MVESTGPIHEDLPWSVWPKADVHVQGPGSVELRAVVLEVDGKRQVSGGVLSYWKDLLPSSDKEERGDHAGRGRYEVRKSSSIRSEKDLLPSFLVPLFYLLSHQSVSLANRRP